jgi:hypothetical protein
MWTFLWRVLDMQHSGIPMHLLASRTKYHWRVCVCVASLIRSFFSNLDIRKGGKAANLFIASYIQNWTEALASVTHYSALLKL